MSDVPKMTPSEMIKYADRLDSEIPSMQPNEAMVNFNAAFALRQAAQEAQS